MKSKVFLSNFVLKLIAIITMTIDHIGVFLEMFAYENEAMKLAGLICHYIGRLAFPLFVFLIVEGTFHTHNIKKYVLRLSFIALPIAIFQSILEIIKACGGPNFAYPYPSIFIALILIVLMIWALKSKKIWIKFLSLIPIGISILALFLTGIEAHSKWSIMIWWFPYMLRPQYDVLGIFLGLVFYLAHKATDFVYENQGLNPNLHHDTSNYQFGINLFSILGLVVISILHYILVYFIPYYVYWNADVQLFSMVSSLLILFYNGKRGYDKKWFKVSSYLYYPVHLVLIFLIFNIIFML